MTCRRAVFQQNIVEVRLDFYAAAKQMHRLHEPLIFENHFLHFVLIYAHAVIILFKKGKIKNNSPYKVVNLLYLTLYRVKNH